MATLKIEGRKMLKKIINDECMFHAPKIYQQYIKQSMIPNDHSEIYYIFEQVFLPRNPNATGYIDHYRTGTAKTGINIKASLIFQINKKLNNLGISIEEVKDDEEWNKIIQPYNTNPYINIKDAIVLKCTDCSHRTPIKIKMFLYRIFCGVEYSVYFKDR